MKRVKANMRILSACSIILFFASPALAQVSSLRGHNSKAPFNLEADRFEVRDKEGTTLFTGNVVAAQGSLKLVADRARTFYTRVKTKVTIRRVDAQGAVKLTSPSETVTAAWGIYDLDTSQITLGGDVTLTRGSDVVKGQRLELNLRTGLTTLDGGAGAGLEGKPAPTRGSDGRVRATFTVPERKTN
jgi:lipopolysaccharide export system protein LptA